VAWKAADTMDATVWFLVSPIAIIPQKMKYSSVKYMKKIYQKNLAAVHLNPIMPYTMAPNMQA
jgi:hypothetical protein